MSDPHSLEQQECDSKENQKRRQRVEAVCGGSGNWQIASNSRCIACGRIGALCECQTSRMDPQLKRRKLETFLLNTPYVRCKQLKALDDAGREESKHRRRLVEQWADELGVVTHIAFTQRRLLSVILEEVTCREVLVTTERKEWMERMAVMDRHVVFQTLALHEREERMRLHMSASREVQMVVLWHKFTFYLLSLYSRESAFRDALVNHEAAERAALKSLEMEFLNMAERNETNRRQLYWEFSEKRESLFSEWHGGMEAIRSAATTNLDHIQYMIHARSRLSELCWKQKVELGVEEKKERQNLYDVAIKDGHRAMEKARVCKQQQDLMLDSEATARATVVQEAAVAYTVLFEQFGRGKEEARNMEDFKWQNRETLLRAAIQQIQCIVVEEAQEAESLKALEHNERDQRYQWILKRERQRHEVEQFSLRQMQLLFDEEDAVRRQMLGSMRDTEVGIAAWLHQKARKLHELMEICFMQKGEIRLQEHEKRFGLVSQKAEHEYAVRHWMEQKEIARQAIFVEEAGHRNNGLEEEQVEREKIDWCFAAELDACYCALRERMETLGRLQQRAMISLQEIMEQEVAAMLLLQRAAQEDREQALHEERYRHLLGVLSTETEHRSYILQQEVRYRDSICTKIALQERYFTKEAQELLKSRICEVVIAEESQRHVLNHMVGELTESLYLQFRQSLENARRSAEKRIYEELRQREIKLSESTRLYRDDEELTQYAVDALPGNMNNKTDQQSSADQICTVDESCDIHRQFVLTELGVEEKDSACISSSGINFLANVLMRIAQMESLRTTDLQQAEMVANETKHKMTNQKQALSEIMGRVEESREKLRRDAAEHNTRVAMRREARQRMDAQLERERARLRSKTEELRQMRNALSGVRDAIHNRYQNR